jgi:hypothetical protein
MNKRVIWLVIFLIITSEPTIIQGLKTGFVAGIPHTIVNGVYKSIYNDMCFDLIKNSATKGYDPKFLSMPIVKESCNEALKSGYIMGFCDKSLGTL